MDHTFKDCDLAYNVWTTISPNCPSPSATDYAVIDCNEHIWDLKNSCHKLFDHPLEKNFTIYWAIWIHYDEVVFKGSQI